MKVCLGFDDHMSVYEISLETAEQLQGMYDVDNIVAHIVDHGERQDLVDVNDTGTFLWISDPTVDSLTEFLDDLATDIVLEQS